MDPDYYVHVFCPLDEDPGPMDNPPIRVAVSRPFLSDIRTHSPSSTASNGDIAVFTFTDAGGYKMTIQEQTKPNRIVRSGNASMRTGLYCRNKLVRHDPGFKLNALELELTDVQSGRKETVLVSSNGFGARYMFHKNLGGTYEMEEGWHAIHPDVYEGFCRDRKEMYLWAYQRFIKPIPSCLPTGKSTMYTKEEVQLLVKERGGKQSDVINTLTERAKEAIRSAIKEGEDGSKFTIFINNDELRFIGFFGNSMNESGFYMLNARATVKPTDSGGLVGGQEVTFTRE